MPTNRLRDTPEPVLGPDRLPGLTEQEQLLYRTRGYHVRSNGQRVVRLFGPDPSVLDELTPSVLNELTTDGSTSIDPLPVASPIDLPFLQDDLRPPEDDPYNDLLEHYPQATEYDRWYFRRHGRFVLPSGWVALRPSGFDPSAPAEFQDPHPHQAQSQTPHAPPDPIITYSEDREYATIEGVQYDLTDSHTRPGELSRTSSSSRNAMMGKWEWVYGDRSGGGRWYEKTELIRLTHLGAWVPKGTLFIQCAYSGDDIPVGMESKYAFRLSANGPWVLKAYQREYIQNPRTGEWVRGPGRILGYHHGVRERDRVSPKNPFLIGFEIEKEDAEARWRVNIGEFSLPQGWAAEKDSSLGDDGFEVITRAYNLKNKKQMELDFDLAAPIINAKHSRKCGGHINISDYRYIDDDSSEFVDRIKPMFPFLMALYPQRLLNSYVACAKMERLKADRGANHYSPFCFKADRIELRIPGAVRSVKNLKWRLNLISYFLTSSKDEPLTHRWMRQQLVPGGAIRSMLENVYCKNADPLADPEGDAKVREKIRLYTEFSKYFLTQQSVDKSIHQYLRHAPDVPRAVREYAQAEEGDFEPIEF